MEEKAVRSVRLSDVTARGCDPAFGSPGTEQVLHLRMGWAFSQRESGAADKGQSLGWGNQSSVEGRSVAHWELLLREGFSLRVPRQRLPFLPHSSSVFPKPAEPTNAWHEPFH